MNAYRTALILCRAAIIALWMRAGLGLVAGVIMASATQAGFFGTRLPSGTTNGWIPLSNFVFTAVVAVFLGIFAPSLCACATGSATLEGESLVSRRNLEPHEQALAWTGAGFILLFSAAASIFLSLFFSFYELFFTPTLRTPSLGRDVMIYNVVSGFIPLTLHCLAGFVLSFRLGLRRMVKSAE